MEYVYWLKVRSVNHDDVDNGGTRKYDMFHQTKEGAEIRRDQAFEPIPDTPYWRLRRVPGEPPSKIRYFIVVYERRVYP
jgi:hypothetical protein